MLMNEPSPWGEHLCFVSRCNGVPIFILVDEGIGEDDEFSHDGCEGDFWFFAVVSQPLIKRLDVRVGSDSGDLGSRAFSEFIEFGDHGGCGNRSDPRDGGEDSEQGVQGGIFDGGLGDGRLEGFDMALRRRDPRPELVRNEAELRALQAVGQCRALRDAGPSCDDQFAQRLDGGRRRWCRAGP